MEENSCSCSHPEPPDQSEIRKMEDQIEYMKEILSKSGCQEPMYRRCMMRNSLREKLSKKQKSKQAAEKEKAGSNKSKNGAESTDFDPSQPCTTSRGSSVGSGSSHMENESANGSAECARKKKKEKKKVSFGSNTTVKMENGNSQENVEEGDAKGPSSRCSASMSNMLNDALMDGSVELREHEEEQAEAEEVDEEDEVIYEYVNDEGDFCSIPIEFDNIETVINTGFRIYIPPENPTYHSKIKSSIAHSHMLQRCYMRGTFLSLREESRAKYKNYMVAVEKRNQMEWQRVTAFDRAAQILEEIGAKLDRLKMSGNVEEVDPVESENTTNGTVESNINVDSNSVGENGKYGEDENVVARTELGKTSESDKENTTINENGTKL